MTGQVIFVEDDDALRQATAQALELAGIDVLPFARADHAMAAVTRDFAGAIVSDIRMPHMDGLELLAAVRAIDADIPVILITGHGDIAMAVGAMRDGAADFLTKPFATDHLVAAVRRSLDHRALVMDNRRLRLLAEQPADDPLIGDSPVMQRLRHVVRQLAEADIDVLVEGETGTGKELVATLLHRWGRRRARPLMAVNCGALSEGLAEIELFGHASDSVPHTRLSRVGQIAGPAAARAGGTRGPSDWRRATRAGRPPRRGDEQDRSGRSGQGGAIPRRPALSTEHRAPSRAAIARTRRRHAHAVRIVRQRCCRAIRPTGMADGRRDARAAAPP